MSDRWQGSDVPRGSAYDRRFDRLAASGMDVHGEAALVASYGPTSVLDAGCGTGENALSFASRGHKVTGIDFLEEPIIRARRKASERGLTATFLVMDALV